MSTTLQIHTNTGLNACPPLCSADAQARPETGTVWRHGLQDLRRLPWQQVLHGDGCHDDCRMGCWLLQGGWVLFRCWGFSYWWVPVLTILFPCSVFYWHMFLFSLFVWFFLSHAMHGSAHTLMHAHTHTLTPSWDSSWLARVDPPSVMVFCFPAYPILGQWLTRTGGPILCDGVFFSSLPHTGSVADPHGETHLTSTCHCNVINDR